MLSYYEPLLAVPGCTGSLRPAQATGPTSWNDAYNAEILQLIVASNNVGLPLIDSSRLISYDLIQSADGREHLKSYITNTKVPFIWQNSMLYHLNTPLIFANTSKGNGDVTTEVPADAVSQT